MKRKSQAGAGEADKDQEATGLAGWLLLGRTRVVRLDTVERSAADQLVAERADRQHHAVLSGDMTTGVYGEYPPTL